MSHSSLKNLPNSPTGYVNSIETAGFLDGPGTRTVVFIQGCGLNCAFCHNPECLKKDVGKSYTSKQLADELLQYREFWGHDGGVTFSGGEPTLQARFLAAVSQELDAISSKKVHVTIDSCLFTSKNSIDTLLPVCDYWMVSIKHLDSAVHRRLTGQGNEVIFKNLAYLDAALAKLSKEMPAGTGAKSRAKPEAKQAKKSLRLRYLVLPGITDTQAYAKSFARYAKSLKSLDFVELLAYSDHAKAKWERLNQVYRLPSMPNATTSDIERVRKALEQGGVSVNS